MSRRGDSQKLELKLNISPPPPPSNPEVDSPNASVSSLEMPAESSCVSFEPEETSNATMQYTSRPAVTTIMLLAGCPQCLMYVMLSDVDRKCPRCKSAAWLIF